MLKFLEEVLVMMHACRYDMLMNDSQILDPD